MGGRCVFLVRVRVRIRPRTLVVSTPPPPTGTGVDCGGGAGLRAGATAEWVLLQVREATARLALRFTEATRALRVEPGLAHVGPLWLATSLVYQWLSTKHRTNRRQWVGVWKRFGRGGVRADRFPTCRKLFLFLPLP